MLAEARSRHADHHPSPMSHRAARLTAWAAFALACALWTVDLVVAYLTRDLQVNTNWSTNFAVGIAYGLMLLTFPIAGLLICTRRPGSPIGWLLMATGLSWILSGATTVADYGLRLHPGSIPAANYLAVLGSALWVPAIGICGTYLLLLFPDGRLPSPRWRWVLHLSTFVIVGGTLSLVLTPGLMGDAGYPHTVNPLGVDALAGVLDYAHSILILLPLAMLLSAASVVVRFRHAGAVERTQITWLAAAASTVVIIYALVLPMSAVEPSGVPPGWLQAAQAVALLSFGLIPAAVLVAVLRYRLYEIDVIIRRTVTYTVLAAVLGVTYLAGIWLLGSLLRSLTGASGALAVTLSTLAVWAAFQPLRGRVQALVDRRFSRSRYDADRTLAAFSGRLRDQLDLEALEREMLDVVRTTVHPGYAELWLRDRELRP
jgi:hypothetical protein